MEDENKPKISNVEWGLVIGALLVVDLVQIVLDLVAIGAILNRFIDIFVGLCFAFYLQMRGQSLVNPKRLMGLIGTFVGEMIPVVDALPLWCLDGIFNMMISKSDKIMKNIPGGSIVAGAMEMAEGKSNSLDNRSFSQKINDSTSQIRALDEQIKNQRDREE